MREYRIKNPDRKWNSKGYADNLTMRIRLLALNKISNELKCVNCGCDELSILEINHKNGGGTREIRGIYRGHSREFYRAIKNGVRNTDDLEILCKLCNILHDVEKRLNVSGFKVIYQRSGIVQQAE